MSFNIKMFMLFFYSFFQKQINSCIKNKSSDLDEIITISIEDISYDILCHNHIESKRAKTLVGEEPVLLYLREKFINSTVFYDIGANIGTHSIFMAKTNPTASVVSFEPEKENFCSLMKNISHNKAKNIDAHNIGLGTSISFGDLFLFSGLSGDGGNTLVPIEGGTTQSIILADLDTYSKIKKLPPPDLIKIDVEGYELQVLIGMRNILTTFKPVLLIELHPQYLQSQFGNEKIVHDFFELIDYKVLELPQLTRGSQMFILAYSSL